MCTDGKGSADKRGWSPFGNPIYKRAGRRNVAEDQSAWDWPGGLGGVMTALAVNVNTYPTHIAGLPVAVNICCHVNRHIVREL